MTKLYPALQKFYTALKSIQRFSKESNFIDNIGCIDVFLSEYRSITLVLQTTLGSANDSVYLNNRDSLLLKDKDVAKWFNDGRVQVVHQHPFKLKKILRVIIYDYGRAVEYKRIEQTIEDGVSISTYLDEIKKEILSIGEREVNFSIEYFFVDKSDNSETNLFHFIEKGISNMWTFLKAMKRDLVANGDITDKLMMEIEEILVSLPPRWMIDSIDYTFFLSSNDFKRGELVTMLLPDIRMPMNAFYQFVNQFAQAKDYFEAFILMHTLIYLKQNRNILTTFFIEYDDETYQTIAFASTIRTTMYRYVNRVAEIVTNNKIKNVYLATEMIHYDVGDYNDLLELSKLSYIERINKSKRNVTLLSFYKITSIGSVVSKFIDTNRLIEGDSLNVAISRAAVKDENQIAYIMLTPIVENFRKISKKRVV